MAWMLLRRAVPAAGGEGGPKTRQAGAAEGTSRLIFQIFYFLFFFYIFYPRGTLRGTKNPVTGYSTIFEFTRIYMNLHEFT